MNDPLNPLPRLAPGRDHKQLAGMQRKTRLRVYLVLLAILLAPLAGFWLYYLSGKQQLQQQFRENALNLAQSLMVQIDVEQHASLNGRAQNDPLYRQLLEQIRAQVGSHPELLAIHSFALNGDEVRTLLDSATPPDDAGSTAASLRQPYIPDNLEDLLFTAALREQRSWYSDESSAAVRACVPFPVMPGSSYPASFCTVLDRQPLSANERELLQQDSSIAVLMLLISLAVFFSLLLHQRQHRLSLELLQRQRDLFLTNSLTDPLTGALNRRAFHLAYASAQSQLQRHALPFALISFDLDRFKRINDQYGHSCGDALLGALVSKFNEVLRSSDLLARLGGEEFSIICNVPDADSALRMAEKLRQVAQEVCVTARDGTEVCCAISLGIYLPAKAELMSDALERVDQALYRAKAAGRDRSEVYWRGDKAPA